MASFHGSKYWSTIPCGRSLYLRTASSVPSWSTQEKLLEYKQFKAARLIQAYFRRWSARNLYLKKLRAIRTIQNFWMGFKAERKYFKEIELILQCEIKDVYQNSAIKIQSIFRGWRVRNTVNNIDALKHAQEKAVISLMMSMAHEMYQLKQNQRLPGVYTLLNTKKVGLTLDTLKFRFYNDVARIKVIQQNYIEKKLRLQHTESKFLTRVPYSGPDYDRVCEPCETKTAKDYDKNFMKIIEKYDDESKRDKALTEIARSRKLASQIKHLNDRREIVRGFCGSVIQSMQRWSIWNETKIKIKDSVCDSPIKLTSFLEKVQSAVAVYEHFCYCNEPKKNVTF